MGIPLTIAWAAEQPWALRPATLALMRAILVRRHVHGKMSEAEIEEALATGEPQRRMSADRLYDPETDAFYEPRYSMETGAFAGYFSQVDGQPLAKGRAVVAVLGVYGVISQRQAQVEDISGPGGTSVERLTQRFRSVIADGSVRAVVFDHDSPGGGVYGVEELAKEIVAARGKKPIAAVANSLSASASYWLASAADEIVVTPSGEVGSIGVFSAHEDLSKFLDAEGIKVTLVSAGKFKVEGNPFEALGEEARAAIQARVDDYYGAFVRAVAKGRGVSPEDVRKGFGQGRVVGSKEAVSSKMADREGTLDETVRRLSGRSASPVAAQGPARDYSAENEAEAARARVRAR